MLAAFLTAALFAPDIVLDIDAREAQYGLVHTHETLAVKPGKLSLSYPKWHPGNHRPTGPLNNMVNLSIRAGGKVLPWKRDNVELYRFLVDVPAGVTSLEIEFDDAAEAGTTFTPHLARLQWNRFLLYPTGRASDDVTVQATVSVPPEWTLATPLLKLPTGGNQIPLRTVSLTEFVDSPGLAGKNFKRVDLAEKEAIDIVGETPASIAISPETVAGSIRLVEEANALFGAKHYRHYDFLVSLSSLGGGMGLEHHECSEDGSGTDTLTTPVGNLGFGRLIAHEYVHSWNGKYRRPTGLATANYDESMKGDLLWVYEGMTQFWGEVLSARSGLASQNEFRQGLANTAAYLALGGRSWRPLEDTAVSVTVVRGASRTWSAMRRGTDYYDESIFIWLEADSIIRRESKGKKSLDDFCKLFHGGKSGPPMVKPYNFEEVVATLKSVVDYDWAVLLRTRVSTLQPELSLAGLENEGWRLTWTDTPPVADRMRSRDNGSFYALGVRLGSTGMITDVVLSMVGGKAGLRPGMRVSTLNGEAFGEAKLMDLLKARTELDFGIEFGGEKQTIHVPYTGGLRFPRLERIPEVPDLLSELAKAHAK